MSDRAALLAAICANPDDDTPRLVFADWLDEHADHFPLPDAVRTRAWFIRTDIGMPARDEYDPTRLRWELIEKPQHEAGPWVNAALPPGPWRTKLFYPKFRRGFPWGLAHRPSRFLALPDEVLGALPLTTLAFRGADRSTDDLFRSPRFARITGLHTRGVGLSPRTVQLLADSPQTAALEALHTDGSDLPALLGSALFPRLTALTLNGATWLGPALVDHLHRTSGPVRLRELEFSGTGLTGRHVEQLLAAPAVQGLVRLSLANNSLGLIGHAAVARAPLAHLRDLDLSGTRPGAEGLRALAAAPLLAKLHRLAYGYNAINSELMAELANCHEADELRVLDLTSNPIGNEGTEALVRSPLVVGLRVLNLSYCMVGDEGIAALLDSSLVDELVALTLTGSPASALMKRALKARMGDRVRL